MVGNTDMQSERYKAYPEYKDSGVEWLGDIPSSWNAQKLKYLCTYNDDVLAESTPKDKEIVYVDIGSVSATEGITNTETITYGNSPSRARRIVKDGDVIISTVRTYLEAIAPINNPPENMVVSTGFAVIRPRSEFYKGFASYSLRFKGFIGEVVSRSVGVSYPAINSSDLVNIEIPTPPVDEQKQIAKFLDYETTKIDTLIEKQQRLIELLTEKRQAVISHAVTKGLNPDVPMKDSGIEWLGEVPAHWEVGSLRWFIDIASGKGLSAEELHKEKSENHSIPVVGGNGVMGFTNKVNTENKALAIGRVGALCGNVHLINYNAWITDNALKISRWRGFSQEYLAKLLEAANLNELASKTAQPLITGEQVKSLTIVVPPLSEQKEIASFIDKMHVQFNLLIQKAQQAIQLMQERRTALISAAVTGKIDVRDWVKR